MQVFCHAIVRHRKNLKRGKNQKEFKNVKTSEILWDNTDLGGKVKTGRGLYSLSLKCTRFITKGKEYQENKSKLSQKIKKNYSNSHPL